MGDSSGNIKHENVCRMSSHERGHQNRQQKVIKHYYVIAQCDVMIKAALCADRTERRRRQIHATHRYSTQRTNRFIHISSGVKMYRAKLKGRQKSRKIIVLCIRWKYGWRIIM